MPEWNHEPGITNYTPLIPVLKPKNGLHVIWPLTGWIIRVYCYVEEHTGLLVDKGFRVDL